MDAGKEKLSFINLVKQIDEEEHAQRDRGSLFELLTKVYLENEPMYRQMFDKVWLLKDVPEDFGIPKKDTGVDLVAKKRNSKELFAIQSKYYSSDYKISKSDIDSFLNEVGKKYYTEGIIFTSTPNWTENAEEAIRQRDKTIARIDLFQLQESKLDWTKFSFSDPQKVELKARKSPRPHQIEAINAVLSGFESSDRGKLIMAPGTGKTYTSMVIAEKLAEKKEDSFKVLYLVPSIQLLSQALKGWTADSKCSMDTIAVCSDRKVTKKSGNNELEDISAADIGYPSTTNFEKILKYQKEIESATFKSDIIVVFSTYQSIDVVSEAQNHGFYNFDLIIADEAHRTTGTTKSGEEDTHFVKVHKDSNIKAEKRLYQTATPRIYGDNAKEKADEKSAILYDMDNIDDYGEEFYYLGFGQAVHRGILTDYKVMVLAVDESMVQKEMQHVFADENNELQFDDVTKIIGTWNGLLKRKSNSNELYGIPMKRAIAFTGTINKSKQITKMYQQVINDFVGKEDVADAYKVDVKHADGSMNALEKNHKIDWLKNEVPENSVKILSNARFLTEGIDVPDLDAVLFLQPRRSEIDIAQAVGRVMRKSPGKEYGYVILPIGVPEGVAANQVLDNNEKYAVVWDMLNALRSIDERFDAMINKLDLNNKKPSNINVIGVNTPPEVNEEQGSYSIDEKSEQLSLDLREEWSELEHAIFGKIVEKVGTTKYWENWSKDVARIAEQHITRINALIKSEPTTNLVFDEFLRSLKFNINDSISQEQAIEMLAQHMITKPVFDSLFEEESFALKNPVSNSMNEMVQRLENLGFNKDTEELIGFYESVRLRAEGIDNLEAKQTIIVQLYEKFFKEAFPKTTESLGIVFTPIEVVDFIIHSANDALKKHFNKTISDINVNILDPFTGTGTFITRLIQSGLINKEDLIRKYTKEIFANEIVLLSYYIAAINIEETFKEINENVNNDTMYYPFEGIILTDTFDTTEQENTLDDDLFGDNNDRIKRQKESPITVILGNPPYSAGASSDNDNNANESYPKLDSLIEKTYAKDSTAKMKKSLYDSYIRAFKWASERIKDNGVIGFVTNASFINGQTTDGLRKHWEKDFNYIYIYNLRGDQRTLGEKSRQEGGKIFGSGSRTPIAITILVKDNSSNHKILYKEVEDYLDREAKLEELGTNSSIKNIDWTEIIPNNQHDWINQRDENYGEYIPLVEGTNSVFNEKLTGVNTSRDAWVYGFSKDNVIKNSEILIENYNDEVDRLKDLNPDKKSESINLSPNYINWSRSLRNKIMRNEKILLDQPMNGYMVLSQYRPFVKKWLFYQKDIVEMPGRYLSRNIETGYFHLMQTTGKGSTRGFSTIITNYIPNFDMMNKGQGYTLENKNESGTLNLKLNEYNLNTKFADEIGLSIEDTFFYVYAILHSNEYLTRYQDNLTKEIPRIPIVNYKESFVDIGRKLAKLHLHYENIEAYTDIQINYKNEKPSYKVNKIRFANKRGECGKLFKNKTSIIFNKDITIENIPEKVYEYVVNGRSAIEWIMDQYQMKTDKKSGITDDPNEYSDNPKYIFNLLLSIINVSVQTVDLVNSLPPLEIIEE